MTITQVLINRYATNCFSFVCTSPYSSVIYIQYLPPPVEYNIIIIIRGDDGVMCRVRVMTRDFIIVMIYIIIIFLHFNMYVYI